MNLPVSEERGGCRKSSVLLSGAYLGFCWGLFSWAAVSAVQCPPVFMGVLETLLTVILWAGIAHIVACIVEAIRLPGDRETLSLAATAGVFVFAYTNYLLHPYLIAGVYLLSRPGFLISAAMLVLFLPPALLLRGGRLGRAEELRKRLFFPPVAMGFLFVFGRCILASMLPGSGRLPIAFASAFLLFFLTAIVFRKGMGGAPWSVLRVLVPAVLIAVIMGGSVIHGFDRFLRRSMESAGRYPASPSPPVILISLDTVRPDHLSLYGYRFDTTPRLVEFASSAVTYDQAYSVSSWTLPAHASIYTGVYPREHGAHYPPGARPGVVPGEIDRTLPTLAQVMSAQGYHTAAIAANRLAVSPEYGLERGFDDLLVARRLTDKPMPFTTLKALGRLVRIPSIRRIMREHDDAATITDRALAWVERCGGKDRPFFLFLNYIDPHTPYAAPARYDVWGARRSWRERFREIVLLGYETKSSGIDLDETDRAILDRHYDREISYLDHELGRLFAGFEESGLLDRAWIVIVSDHGEFLGEHHRRNHGKALYEEVTRAVLIVRPPGGVEGGGRREVRLASTLEIPRLIAEAVGFAPPRGMVRHRPDQSGFVICEKYLTHRYRRYLDRDDVGRLRAVLMGGWKWIVADPGGTEELYHLVDDGDESVNRAEGESGIRNAMRARYAAWLEGTVSPFPDGGVGRDQEKKDALRALGYLD